MKLEGGIALIGYAPAAIRVDVFYLSQARET